MVGPCYSVLGVQVEKAIQKMKNGLPVKFTNASGPCKMCGISITLDNTTLRPVEIKRINILE